MKLQFIKKHPQAEIPEFQTDGAACFDMVAAWAEPPKGKTRVYGTGLSANIPDGYYLEVAVRSGLAFKHDFCLANGIAIIDADYTGEIKVKLFHYGQGTPEWPWPGDRIVQARLVKTVKTEITEAKKAKETERGENGFGSTGK